MYRAAGTPPTASSRQLGTTLGRQDNCFPDKKRQAKDGAMFNISFSNQNYFVLVYRKIAPMRIDLQTIHGNTSAAMSSIHIATAVYQSGLCQRC